MIIGVDEAGRGPLAGPVVAAAVILCPGGIAGLDDSKKLSARRRAVLEAQIFERCAYALGEASVAEIDTINILQATMLAMRRAVDALVALPQCKPLPFRGGVGVGTVGPHGAGGHSPTPGPSPEGEGGHALHFGVGEYPFTILVDGNRLPKWSYPATAVVGGDAIHPCISAASILAKEHRDRLMVDADRRWPDYGFAQHKGYGTAAHMVALYRHGPCPIHRRSFAPVRQAAIACDRGRPSNRYRLR